MIKFILIYIIIMIYSLTLNAKLIKIEDHLYLDKEMIVGLDNTFDGGKRGNCDIYMKSNNLTAIRSRKTCEEVLEIIERESINEK